MANEIDISFGGFDLSLTNKITVSKIDPKMSKTVNVHKIPKSDMARDETARRDPYTFSLEGDVSGTDYDNLRSNIDSLKAALQNGKQKLTIDNDRYIMAQCSSLRITFASMHALARWEADFTAADPVWLSETLTTDERVPTSGAGYTINNPGNVATRVKIEVTAPGGGIADNCQIENTTSGIGEICKYRGTIAAGKKLEIDNRVDTEEFEVLNDGTDDIANFEGDFITLAPGDNTIEYTGTAGATVKLSYRAAYY